MIYSVFDGVTMSDADVGENSEKIIKWCKKNWKFVIFFPIIVGIIILFSVSIIYKEEIYISTMNSWVSIILGLTATFMSIISMYLSFYNLEKSNTLNKENNKLQIDIVNTMKEANIIFLQNRKNIESLGKSVEEIENIKDILLDKIQNLQKGVDKMSQTYFDFQSSSGSWMDHIESGE